MRRRTKRNVFETRITTIIAGKPKRMSRIDVALLKLFQKAMQGDVHASKAFVDANDKDIRSKALTGNFDEPVQLAPMIFVAVDPRPRLDD